MQQLMTYFAFILLHSSPQRTLDYKILLQISFFCEHSLFLTIEYEAIKDIMVPIQREGFRSVKNVQ
jgi:hypothetical protein